MKAIVEVFSGILLLMILTYAEINVSVATYSVECAENYRATVTAEIENSNFNPNVIDACKNEAVNMGYDLQIANCTYDEQHDIQTAEIVLTYDYRIPLFGIEETRSTRGIAR